VTRNLYFRYMLKLAHSRIVLSVTNDLVTDQRVHRIATTLTNHGADLTLVGRRLPNSLPVHRRYHVRRMNLLFTKGPAFYAEYNIRLFLYLLFCRADVFVANDLDTLPANYLVSLLRRKTLVYDAHEFFTEVPELIGRETVKKLWLKIEQHLLPKITHSYTVCQSIADAYTQRYGISMNVVRNVPVKHVEEPEKDRIPGLPTSTFVIYQGAVNKGRGLEHLVDAFEFIENMTCVIIGHGDIYLALKERIERKGLENKVSLLGQIPFSELIHITPLAALGVSIEENLGLNYYYALPNKLFDYIQAKIPVLVSDFPEMSKIITTYQIGEVLHSHYPKDLAAQIITMTRKENVTLWKENLYKAAEELCWGKEEEKLLAIYENLWQDKDSKPY
jgi:glycosyltransferase involved in cell wall biosynthesis